MARSTSRLESAVLTWGHQRNLCATQQERHARSENFLYLHPRSTHILPVGPTLALCLDRGAFEPVNSVHEIHVGDAASQHTGFSQDFKKMKESQILLTTKDVVQMLFTSPSVVYLHACYEAG